MSTGTLQTYAPALIAGACALLAALSLHRSRAQRARMHHIMDRARRDALFVRWARWTFLSVTDAQGGLFYRSIYDLHRDGPDDLIWGMPRAVIFFHADPDDSDPYGMEEEITRG